MKVHHLNCGTMNMPTAPMVCHVLLVETDNSLVLVDSGFGSHDCLAAGRRTGPTRHLTKPAFLHTETAAHQIEKLGFDRRDVRNFRPPEGPPGVIVCNPPYGERIGEEKDLRGLYRLLGEVFAERCRGWTAYVFTGNPSLAAAVGLTPAEQVPLYNGKIPCRLLKYELS